MPLGDFLKYFTTSRASSPNLLGKVTAPSQHLDKLNDSVWELYKPPNDQAPRADVLFFHGAQLSNDTDTFWKTWLSRDETVLWPYWLAKEFPDARLLLVSYDSFLSRYSGQRDAYQTIENLMHDLIWSSNCQVGRHCPVIFAAHCYGGLIVKDLLVTCRESLPTALSRESGTDSHAKEIETFLRNCKAIGYYSTPNEGSNMVEGLKYWRHVLGKVNQPMVEYLKVLSETRARKNQKFATLHYDLGLDAKAVGETRATQLDHFTKVLVVPNASALQSVDPLGIYWAQVDHIQVSRAENHKTCPIYRMLRDLIKTNMKQRDNRPATPSLPKSGWEERMGTRFQDLSDEVLISILSITSPKDVKTLVDNSKSLNETARFDFLRDIAATEIEQSVNGEPMAQTPAGHIILRDGRRGFYLDTQTGGVCRTFSANELHILHGDNGTYWTYGPKEGSRFPDVAILDRVWFLNLSFARNSNIVLPPGEYTILWVLRVVKDTRETWGAPDRLVEFRLTVAGRPQTKKVELFLTTGNRWMAYNGGHFTVTELDQVYLEASMVNHNDNNVKMGLWVDGIIIYSGRRDNECSEISEIS